MDYLVLEKLITAQIRKINRICDMVSIELITPQQKKFFLHIQSFFRILKNDKVVICASDMYRRSTKLQNESFDWDKPGQTLYDDAIDENIEELCGVQILDIHQSDSGDLRILFSSNFSLEIFVDTIVSEEKFRIFNDDICYEVRS